jgi:HAD superfamily hydrolase (TIGR01509 family)
MIKKYKALLFDLNGTMIDDMNYHIAAWHRILNELGANLPIEKVKEECYGKNHELLERIFPGRFSEYEKTSMSFEKEKQYQREFLPQLKLINGLDAFLAVAYNKGFKMAIGSAAITFNIDFVLDNLGIRKYFGSLVSADEVTLSKPHPETYLKCAEQLAISPGDCLVFEDTPKGVTSAANAGMKCVVITTMHTKEEFISFNNIIAFAKDFTNPSLMSLLNNY